MVTSFDICSWMLTIYFSLFLIYYSSDYFSFAWGIFWNYCCLACRTFSLFFMLRFILSISAYIRATYFPICCFFFSIISMWSKLFAFLKAYRLLIWCFSIKESKIFEFLTICSNSPKAWFSLSLCFSSVFSSASTLLGALTSDLGLVYLDKSAILTIICYFFLIIWSI